MSKKKILIVSRAFYPGNWPRAFRATELAKEFARQGHNVVVITPKTEVHFDFEKIHKITIKDLGKQKWQGFDFKGNKIIVFFKKILAFILNWLFEFPNIGLAKLVSNALKNENNYDLIISIAKPYSIHWGVGLAKSKNLTLTKVWVADCGDPFLRSSDNGLNPPFYFHWIDSWFLKKVDYVTIPISEAKSAYNQKYINKLRVIPQGFKFEDIKLFEGEIKRNKTVFGYAGMFIPGKRDPSEFIEYLISLDNSYNFEFNIYTHNKQIIEPYVEKSNGRIKLNPTMPRNDVLFELSKMDFVVNFENTGKTQSPSKLIDYGILKKPILSIKFKSLDKDNVIKFLNKNYEQKMSVKNIERYRIENVCQSFLDLTIQ